ncbi:hypothetical protein ACFLZL_04835 [Thermodesulfobacteriota bacterium]
MACGEKTPDEVYVKDDLYSQSLVASISQKNVVVDNWYELAAIRKTGPWKQIKYASLAGGQCWMVQPPAEIEDNISNSVKWISEPKAHVEFSIPKNPFTEPRKVKFKAVGRYTLKATSPSWCGKPFESNIIDIKVIDAVTK